VANPGTTCDAGYFTRTAADVICIFEDQIGFDTFRRPNDAPPGRLAILAYDIKGADKMREAAEHALKQDVAIIYVTDLGGADPWDRLPRYWNEEVAAVRKE
jgi:hypothetical protein